MKTFIKTILKPAAMTLSFLFSLQMAFAQEKERSMESTKLMDKMDMRSVSYIIPQKPEDISPLLIGEKIPMAIISDAAGKSFDLNKAVSEKPTILIFYRGGWCPYCSRQLSGLQQVASELEDLGYQLIAISTDAPAGLTQSATKQKLSYTLLSDADLNLSKQFGIAYKAPKAYWEMLPKTTEGKNPDLLLPLPSVFILDKAGMIHFEYINTNITKRLNPDMLKAVAATIKNDLN